MNDQTVQLLRELAEKFGTTTEHLWGVLIKQAYISGVGDLITSIAFALAAIYVF